ncbi:uncharacterized protein LOC6652142 isoform X2 [Drosophila willistoni]|uniref:uncharacterized protein LOC6652142 isoform X2 n=1 Tax=Drosophila willistoni TaxID=7260 RepID=UPI001F082FCE|nr:uncharacterized protein LOC6652142 isoform X2 [Drosophila willistoni]
MAHLLRRFMNKFEGVLIGKYFIKSSINMPKMFRSNSGDIDAYLKMEELRTERQELQAHAGKLAMQQRSLEVMLTELTRCIKQMEFDDKQREQGKPHKDAAEAGAGEEQRNTMSSNK